MICPTCWGLGDNNIIYEFKPCPDCGGTGIIHCCEGNQCQPEHLSAQKEVDQPACE